jgi:hypothetical protein
MRRKIRWNDQQAALSPLGLVVKPQQALGALTTQLGKAGLAVAPDH